MILCNWFVLTQMISSHRLYLMIDVLKTVKLLTQTNLYCAVSKTKLIFLASQVCHISQQSLPTYIPPKFQTFTAKFHGSGTRKKKKMHVSAGHIFIKYALTNIHLQTY